MKYKITNQGMGGFLNPPTHPEHHYSLDYQWGGMALSSALQDSNIPEEIKSKIRQLFEGWQKPTPDSTEIQQWIYKVLGYFKSSYQNHYTGSWSAADLEIWETLDPVKYQDKHAGVHFIRKFYPEFIATTEHFDRANWPVDETDLPPLFD